MTAFDLRRELLTNNVREESFWRWIEEELTGKLNYRGFPSMTSYQQRPGGKFLAADRRGNKHENQMIVGFPL